MPVLVLFSVIGDFAEPKTYSTAGVADCVGPGATGGAPGRLLISRGTGVEVSRDYIFDKPKLIYSSLSGGPLALIM